MKNCKTTSASTITTTTVDTLKNDKNTNNGSQLPARATRLLQRRLQNSSNTPSHTGSESPRSVDSNSRRTTPLYKPPSNTQLKDSNEDLLQLDKSFRNTILQDVVNFKTQLVRLRRILQEDEEKLMRTDTLNPFENNGPFFNSYLIDQNTDVTDTNKQAGAHKISDQQNAILEDQRQELADLRRQVVYLQSQMDDKDRTIRIQQNMINKLEAEIDKTPELLTATATTISSIETTTAATQTDRLRPLSIGQEGLASRTKIQVRIPTSNISNNNIKSSKSSLPKKTLSSSSSSSSSSGLSTASTASTTQITSVYSQLSSIKPSIAVGCKSTNSTQPNGHHHLKAKPPNDGKRVRTTFIGQIPTTTNKPYTNGTNGHHATTVTTKKASTIPTPLIRTKY